MAKKNYLSLGHFVIPSSKFATHNSIALRSLAFLMGQVRTIASFGSKSLKEVTNNGNQHPVMIVPLAEEDLFTDPTEQGSAGEYLLIVQDKGR